MRIAVHPDYAKVRSLFLSLFFGPLSNWEIKPFFFFLFFFVCANRWATVVVLSKHSIRSTAGSYSTWTRSKPNSKSRLLKTSLASTPYVPSSSFPSFLPSFFHADPPPLRTTPFQRTRSESATLPRCPLSSNDSRSARPRNWTTSASRTGLHPSCSSSGRGQGTRLCTCARRRMS